MADDSPGKVQALRAIFSENNKPVMGMMPPGGKIPNRPWRTVVTSTDDVTTLKEKKLCELKLGNKVLPVAEKTPSQFNGEAHKDMNGHSDRHRSIPKPVVGPKPYYLLQQQRTVSTYSTEQQSNDSVQNTSASQHRTSMGEQTSESKSKAFGETIASFMFTSNKENDSTLSENSAVKPPPPPVPKPRISSIQNHVNIMNLCNAQNNSAVGKSDLEDQRCNIINSDNYICKSSCKVRRKELPSREKLGLAPQKPVRPPHMKLSQKYLSLSSSSDKSSEPTQVLPPALPQKPIPQRPTYPCPPRPHTPPPLPPILVPVIRPSSLREEIEELYEDTLLGENRRPVSLIPEYTEEEERAEELYHDAAEAGENSFTSDFSPLKPKKPPPPIPTEYLQPNHQGSTEELYQDADGLSEEYYEVMPCDEIPEDSEYPLYSNNKKEIEKLKKEEEKRIRKEQKEKDKKEKELEKIRKKFGLTGEEIPIDDGLVKCDSRGGKGDLPVKRGETVLILRMEGNPSGRWLVKNEKGKIGYVELTNIEVDPLSVKSVMSIRRLSVISNGEELYCEGKSEEEGIYEVTY